MDFELTEHQKEYKREIYNFAQQVANKNKDVYFSHELWKRTAETGIFGLNADEKYSGLNESYLTAAICIEAIGYSFKNSGFVFTINNHLWVAQNLINLYGSETVKDKYLKAMINGDKIGCFAITEADAGSDAYSMRTNAVETEDGFILNGSKMFISNGPIADLFVVVAKMNNNPKKFTAFILEKDFEGFSIGKCIEKMGLEACPSCEIVFTDCKVPKENILGTINNGSFIMTAALEWERCFEFASHIGAMQRVMEMCIEHSRKRKQFNKSISNFQGVTHKIANMKVAIEMSRNYLYKIATMKDKGEGAFLESAIFKLFVSENYVKVCQDAIQIFGAYGYSKEYDLEAEFRSSIASTIYSGTSEIQRNTIFELANLLPYID